MKAHPLLSAYDWAQLERVVVLSPHLDDAALSCGGLLTALRGRVSRLVVTVACGNPLPRKDNHGRARPRRGHVSPSLRRREEMAAMHSVDCDFVHLGFADAVYRRSPTSGELIYRHTRSRWSLPRVDDGGHVEELTLVLRRLCENMGRYLLLAPLGIGRHVDHTIGANVALRLASARRKLLFYEDFPYVADQSLGDGSADSHSAAMARLHIKPVRLFALPYDADAKWRLLSHYSSQVPALFGTGEAMRDALRAPRADAGACERFWSVRRVEPNPGGEQ